ncbi:MAG: hypothetical protein LBK07_09255 [Tannerella sp.]|jgi:hypothetical protein|nr:hypothetical protein [Tannerella sp.]
MIFKPSEAWTSAPREDDGHEAFLSRYVYPLIGVIALAAFLGVLFNRKEFDFVIALKSAIMELVSSAGGFFLGAWLLGEIWRSVFKRPKDMKLCRYFVGYASSLMFLLRIVLSLLPEFFFLHVIVLYTAYIIWEGAVPFMLVRENEQLKFTIYASLAVMLSPTAIYFGLFLLMPGMRF